MEYFGFIKSIFIGQKRREIKSKGRLRFLLFSVLTIVLTNIAIETIIWFAGFQSEAFDILLDIRYAPTVFSLVLVVAIMPFVEECTFRLFLSGDSIHVLISLSLLFATFLTWAMIELLHDHIVNHFIWIVGIFTFLSLNSGIYFGLSFMQKTPFYLSASKFVVENFRFTYYASSILFALSHLLFMQIYSDIPIFMWIMLFSLYLIHGLLLASIRIQINFGTAYLFHAFLNLLSFV